MDTHIKKNFDPLLSHILKLETEIQIQVKPHPTSDLENKMSKIEIWSKKQNKIRKETKSRWLLTLTGSN